MGAEFIVGTLEEMCDLMCDNVVPEKLCDTCIYRNENEYHKPCIVYRDDCEFYEKERGDMTSGYAFNDKCSECGYIVHIQFINEYKYCPNCGARMESEDKE